ncbi:LLM class flavin-dependent oxidoreductase [Corynebacterium felinum]|uniref:Alkanesulfonate monooxygenase SsuD/methylene tetrahydromethanopterin reductase-like flavin-dependent oxidoreductase (Luciferase family) n=1 Tax=Corynebacterium felinum TaxID=131318 RepID=A0ABU2B5P6_9CORY|nr:LLM class flavin-dependent oxidoreductase [Corynebacterium felinum]MDF5820185.1 LLM class flavin-dependent oxidoreductase [Corynebacterium felinum]MDR7353937.1 alkanesulfonate monooxygenase SsuD/methylene tetrahydromethanopterin reductase-like flavin-dependent oxidoreductase (luciferase family) [Corynebacterium felinum]
MKKFGFLSFGHYNHAYPVQRSLHDAIELAHIADSLGINGAYFRVHHFAPQGAAPIPLLSAIAARTSHIEVGTGVIDMRYENPLYLAEELAALSYIADGRLAIGISRGSPEPALKGWEAFGYHAADSEDSKGAGLAREKFLTFLSAIRGTPMAQAAPADQQYPRIYAPGRPIPVLPQAPDLDRTIWWGAATHASAEQAARDGVNLMSSTLVFETDGPSLGEVQARQIERYRAEWDRAGWGHEPRVSVSRSVFPIVSDADTAMFGKPGSGGSESRSMLDDQQGIFGRTLVDTPDKIVEALRNDPAVMSADTLMLTIPNQAGVEVNARILDNFATHVAPELGWEPANR